MRSNHWHQLVEQSHTSHRLWANGKPPGLLREWRTMSDTEREEIMRMCTPPKLIRVKESRA